MYVLTVLSMLLSLSSQCSHIVLSNGDGWAETNIRTFCNVLTAAGVSVVVSAQASFAYLLTRFRIKRCHSNAAHEGMQIQLLSECISS